MVDRRRFARQLSFTAASLLLACTTRAQTWGDVDGPASGQPESIGGYTAGCVIGAEQLPPDGAGYQAIRLERNRHYGHPELVSFIESLAERTEAAGVGLIPIGDMSQPQGGPMIEAHASHQVGLDVDVFFRIDLPRLALEERENLDLPSLVNQEQGELDPRFGEGHIEMLRIAASDPSVQRIFVSPYIKQAMCEREWEDRSFLRTLRPWFGHEDHMHVRLGCPTDSTECSPQAAPPAGDGCGTELASWFERGPLPSRPPGERREPTLPQRCDALN